MWYFKIIKRMNIFMNATIHELKKENVCCVCYEEMQVSDTDKYCLKKLVCGHCMHYLCVRKWVEKKNTYPYCRQDIYTTISKDDIIITTELIDMNYKVYSIEASIKSQIDELQTWNNTTRK